MTFITDINPATPDGTDRIASGDDEIRGLKTMVKSSFPKIAGEVSASQTEMNKLVGVVGNLLADSGGTVTGTMVFTGAVQIDGVDLSISGGAIVGGIIAYTLHVDATATFSSVPVCSVNPSADDHLARKAYVDAAVAGGSDPTTVDIRQFKYARLKMFYYGGE